MSKKSLLIFVLFAFGFVYFLGVVLNSPREGKEIGKLLGQKLPVFSYELLKGEGSFNDKKIRNLKKYKLINFFASWCRTCLMEHKDLMELSKRSDIKIIGIAWKDSRSSAKKWLTRNGNPYDLIGFDKKGKGRFDFGLIGVPESFLVSPTGTVIGHFRGPIDLDKILKEIE